MSKNSPEYGILVAVDGSPESDAAVAWAGREAVLRKLPVTLTHVIVPIVVSWPVRYLESAYRQWQDDNAREVIEKAEKTLAAAIGDATPPTVRTEIRNDGIVTA